MLPSPRLVAAARVLLNLTQKELAAEAGLATSSVARFESGATGLNTGSLEAILLVFKKHRIRFLTESAEAELGLLILKPSATER